MRWLRIILLLLIASTAGADSLRWDASLVDAEHPAPEGYRIHRGTAPGVYDVEFDAGLALQWPIPDDLYGSYYWVASAYIGELRSGYSNEVAWQRTPPEPPQYVGATALRASKYQIGIQQMAKIGDDNILTTDLDVNTDIALLWRFQADATGTLDTAYLYQRAGTAGPTAKIAIYASSAATPQSGDALIGVSPTLTMTSSAGWRSGSIGSGSVTNGSYYWLLLLVNTYGSGAWLCESGGTDEVNYKISFGSFTPAATLGTGWTAYSPYGHISAYVSISGGGVSAVPANRGNVGIMLGMSNAMWLDNDFMKPLGGN